MSSELWISLNRGVLVLHLLLLERHLLFFSSYFFLLSCFKFIKIFSHMLNPIGFIVLPFRLRFIIHLGKDGVIVEVWKLSFVFFYED